MSTVTKVRGPLAGLLASTTLSTTGNAIVAVAVPWVVFARTGSATAAGLAGAAAILPIALSALFGGALIGRIGRTVCAVAADLCSALAVAALPLLGHRLRPDRGGLHRGSRVRRARPRPRPRHLGDFHRAQWCAVPGQPGTRL